MKSGRLVGLCLCTLCFASCSQADKDEIKSAYSYKISEDGAPTVGDKSEYESIDKKTISKEQKYKVVAEGEGSKSFHYLVTKVVQRVGSKITQTDDAYMMPISDGSYTYSCKKYFFDLKFSTSDESTGDPSCSFELLAVIVPTAKPVRIPSSKN